MSRCDALLWGTPAPGKVGFAKILRLTGPVLKTLRKMEETVTIRSVRRD
jgi:hypothetical protein